MKILLLILLATSSLAFSHEYHHEKDWKEGITTSPHGGTFDKDGNVVTTEWNRPGRALRWNRAAK